MRRKIKGVTIGAHPSFYDKMEQYRKTYEKQTGLQLTQIQVTNILSKNIRIPKKINLIKPKK